MGLGLNRLNFVLSHLWTVLQWSMDTWLTQLFNTGPYSWKGPHFCPFVSRRGKWWISRTKVDPLLPFVRPPPRLIAIANTMSMRDINGIHPFHRQTYVVRIKYMYNNWARSFIFFFVFYCNNVFNSNFKKYL